MLGGMIWAMTELFTVEGSTASICVGCSMILMPRAVSVEITPLTPTN